MEWFHQKSLGRNVRKRAFYSVVCWITMSYFTNPTIFNIIRWVTGSLGPTIKIKSLECPESIRNYEKKIMLGTSDAWSMSRSFQRPSDPVTQRIILKIVGFLQSKVHPGRKSMIEIEYLFPRDREHSSFSREGWEMILTWKEKRTKIHYSAPATHPEILPEMVG